MFILMGGSAENGHNPIKLVPVGLMVFNVFYNYALRAPLWYVKSSAVAYI